MKITARQVKRLLQDRWKQLKYVWTWDPCFQLAKVEDLRDYITTSKVPDMEFIDYFNDCDDFANYFLSEIRMKRYIKRDELEELIPEAIGRVFLLGDNIVMPDHKANIAIAEEFEVYILDATDRSMRLADDSDDIRFVDM